MAQRLIEPATDQIQPEALAAAVNLLSGCKAGAPSLNRRRVCQGLVMGTAGLALSPLTMGQVEIPPGQIRLMFNENPYGPSPKALAEVVKILPKTAYYVPLRTISWGCLWHATSSIVSTCFWHLGRTKLFRPR